MISSEPPSGSSKTTIRILRGLLFKAGAMVVCWSEQLSRSDPIYTRPYSVSFPTSTWSASTGSRITTHQRCSSTGMLLFPNSSNTSTPIRLIRRSSRARSIRQCSSQQAIRTRVSLPFKHERWQRASKPRARQASLSCCSTTQKPVMPADVPWARSSKTSPSSSHSSSGNSRWTSEVEVSDWVRRRLAIVSLEIIFEY